MLKFQSTMSSPRELPNSGDLRKSLRRFKILTPTNSLLSKLTLMLKSKLITKLRRTNLTGNSSSRSRDLQVCSPG